MDTVNLVNPTDTAERFRLLVESIRDYAIFTLDPEGHVTSWNAGAQRYKQYRADEIIGRHFSAFYTPEDVASGKPARELEVAAREGRIEDEGWRVRKDGTRFWANVVITALRENGRLVGFAKVTRDLTERMQNEERLRAAVQELDAFAYSVSHDLRAPLRSIDGFSQILLEDYGDKLDDAGRHALERVRAATQHMGGLIDDLLKLSRVSRGELRKERVDLSAIARAIVKEYTGREVAITIAPGLVVEGDPRLLQVALENLLGNAWKYTSKRPDARIELGEVEAAGAVGKRERVFYVRDNGAGFDMRYADKLFAAFQRLHGANEFEGTGVGLATVQRILRRHGGRIWAEAKVGEGATFYFTVGE
ncbi:MAG TPA: ATP-binding protein [Gemmatimonadales bacterium]|nr:ATP-binding protein [Gemmatimonadales bacterium]